MPATPVRELVLENVRTTLAAVEAGTDYFHGPYSVFRTAPNVANTPTDLTLYVFSPGDANVSRDGKGSSAGLVETRILVNVTAIVGLEVASDTHSNQIAHDIEKALCADRYRGTYAMNFYPLGREIISDESTEPWAFLTLRFEALYRTDYANPSTQR